MPFNRPLKYRNLLNPQNNESNQSQQNDNTRRSDGISPSDTDYGSSTTLNSQSSPSSLIKTETHKHYDWEGSWMWEIGGATLSAIGLSLLIGFLGYVDGMTYAKWQYSISPNAVISVLSAFTKAVMLVPISSCMGQLKWNQTQQQPLHNFQVLDDASRGPWGSLSVFWKIRSPLAIMGATLTILSVTLDPFAQQILSFPSRDVVAQNETAYVQRIESYDSSWEHQQYSVGAFSVLNPTMQTAMLTGLAGINKPLEPICPTSSCDYPDFSTLGICSSCDDVTEKATQTCLPIRSNSTLRASFILKMIGEGDDFASAHASCSYSSPSGLILDAALFDTVTHLKGLLQMEPQSFTSIARSNNHTIGSVFMATYDSPLLYTPENLTAPEKRPKMTECSLYPCERLYTQNHVSTKSRALRVLKSQAMVNTSQSNGWIHFIPRNRVTFSPNSNYSIHWNTWYILRKATSIFNTTLDQQPLEKEPGIRLGPVMFNSDNITESFAQMATSMTDNMRSGKGTIHIPGRAFITETYIHVRWLWIMLPVILIILSILHLIVMAVMNRGQPVLWKSSILPLIMGRLETTPEHEIAHLRHMGEVQSISKNIKTVVRQEGRLVFSEED